MLMKNTERSDKSLVSTIHLLHRAGQCADELFNLEVGVRDLTPRQFAVLKAVEKTKDPSHTVLIEMTGIDRSTMADIVRRLVQRGLLERKRTRSDARRYEVRLTAQGRNTLKRAEPAIKATDTQLLTALRPAERNAFVQALQRIVTNLGPISSARPGR